MTITWQGVLLTFGALITLGGGASLLWKYLLGPVMALIGRTNEFLDDWFGTPDRPGVPGRPGVMVRLGSLETDKVDREEFRQLANQVSVKADKHDLEQLKMALEDYVNRTDDENGPPLLPGQRELPE